MKALVGEHQITIPEHYELVKDVSREWDFCIDKSKLPNTQSWKAVETDLIGRPYTDFYCLIRRVE